jgi:hypothetical protein
MKQFMLDDLECDNWAPIQTATAGPVERIVHTEAVSRA